MHGLRVFTKKGVLRTRPAAPPLQLALLDQLLTEPGEEVVGLLSRVIATQDRVVSVVFVLGRHDVKRQVAVLRGTHGAEVEDCVFIGGFACSSGGVAAGGS